MKSSARRARRPKLSRFTARFQGGTLHRPFLRYRGPGEECTAATRCCNFWAWGPQSARPDCCTRHLMELAVFMRDLLARNDVPHWLDWGALLGAVRDGKLIPWDHDIDLCIFADDHARVVALRDEIEAAGFAFAISEDGDVRVYYSRTNSVHLDLYGWEVDDGVLRMASPYMYAGMHGKGAFPASFIDHPEEVTVEGHTFPAPSPVEKFLIEHRYGPDYLIPRPPPARRWNLVPEITEEQYTPTVDDLIQRTWTLERTVDALYARRGVLNTPLWERWVWSGMPIEPRADRVARAREALGDDADNPAAVRLLESIDILEHAIEERNRVWPTGIAARMKRRAQRLMR